MQQAVPARDYVIRGKIGKLLKPCRRRCRVIEMCCRPQAIKNIADERRTVVLKEFILPVYVDITVRRQALEKFEHEAKILKQLDLLNINERTVFPYIENSARYVAQKYAFQEDEK